MPRQYTPRIPLVCQYEQCGKTFLAKPSALTRAKGGGRFCSAACKKANMRHPLEDQFWRYVERTKGCWLWKNSRDTSGYGWFSYMKKPMRAHRVAWELTYGPIPDGLFVCHHCDVRTCVRPDHLFLGTQRDNMDDAVRKGRMRSGDQHGLRVHPDRASHGEHRWNSALTEQAVREIRIAYDSGLETLNSLMSKYGVTRCTISNVLNGVTWKHIHPPYSQRAKNRKQSAPPK